jgi:hypothetical protein
MTPVAEIARCRAEVKEIIELAKSKSLAELDRSPEFPHTDSAAVEMPIEEGLKGRVQIFPNAERPIGPFDSDIVLSVREDKEYGHTIEDPQSPGRMAVYELSDAPTIGYYVYDDADQDKGHDRHRQHEMLPPTREDLDIINGRLQQIRAAVEAT